jgi:lysophospholipase L1-like esterase
MLSLNIARCADTRQAGKVMRYLSVFLLLLLAACGKPELAELHKGSTVLAFGDSLTAGKGVIEDEAYPARLAQMLGLRVVNAGVSGETTTQGLNRLPDVLAEHQPDLVILFEGGNDILRNQDLRKTKANLDAMIEMVKQQGADVVLVAVPKKGLFSGAASFYSELAEQHDLPLQADIVSKLLRQPSMKSDAVHFNRQGYKEVAEAIKLLLEAHGAI